MYVLVVSFEFGYENEISLSLFAGSHYSV